MRIFSRRRREEILRCSFCQKPQAVVEKLISSPGDYERAYICDECIRIGAAAIQQPGSSNEAQCSFCHKGRDAVRLFSSSGQSPTASICEECLTVCANILVDKDDPPVISE